MGNTYEMTWKASGPVEERKKFIEDWLAGRGRDVAGLCRSYGISRKTGYQWLERFRQDGLGALEDRSHARLSQPHRMPKSVELRIVQARKQHPSWGPKKLRTWLAGRDPNTAWPAASTIGEALKRARLTQPQRRVRRAVGASTELTTVQGPNQVWTIDYQGEFRTGDGQWLYPLTVVDSCSRYLLLCDGHGQANGQNVRASMQNLFREHGLPERLRSDNGTPFASTGAGRLNRLSGWWLKLGIAVERIAPGRPQQHGCHERFHRTLKAETARPPAADREQQQQCFELFQKQYNQDRPPEALGQLPPQTVYAPARRPYPEKLCELDYPAYWERRRVHQDGFRKFQGKVCFLSEALVGELVGLVEIDEAICQIWLDAIEVAVLDVAAGRIWRISAGKKPSRGPLT